MKAAPGAAPAPFTAEQEKILRDWTARYPYPAMGLIEALRQVQEWRHCVRPEDEKFLAEIFNMPLSRVHEAATFFPYFTSRPMGRHRLGLCRGLSCALAGSEKISECLGRLLGVKPRQVTADGRLSYEEMECLGACEQAPALIVNEKLKGAASEEKISEWVKDLA